MTRSPTPTSADLRAAFAPGRPFTVGVEEELMLLHPVTLDLEPAAAELVARLGDPARFKREMPAAQLELVTGACGTVAEAAAELLDARRRAAEAAAGEVRIAGGGCHPFTAVEVQLNEGEPYSSILDEFGWAARRQLVSGLHVHVALPDADRAIRVHDALRSYLPLIAALAANGPWYDGQDTGLASVRPKLSELLPRQGVPPVLGSLDGFVEALAWSARAGGLPTQGQWWWELRPHPAHGTLEVRVADSQTTVADTAAVAALVHTLIVWLDRRAAAGETLEVHDGWRIAQNRWSACRHGLDGTMADPVTGLPTPTRTSIGALVEQLGPVAAQLACSVELADVRRLVAEPGYARQRRIGRHGAFSVAGDLTERLLEAPPVPSGSRRGAAG